MSRSTYIINGGITRTDTNAGVHGLYVEAWDDDLRCDTFLGTDLTNEDGAFSIRFCLADLDDCCDACPRVYLKVRDRDCRVIYDGCLDRLCCEPGTPHTINVALPPETLWWHFSSPLSWRHIGGPLVPPNVFDEIDEAVDLLVSRGTPASVADVRLAVCATPSIEVFDRVLDDAWATLQGDLAAAARYHDVLKALCAAQNGCCRDHTPFESEVEAIFRTSCPDDESPEKCRESKPCVEPLPCGEEACACGCSCDPALISNDKAILLLMAALHVSCGNIETAKRYVLTLLDQLCRFEMLGALHRASVRAVLGDKASLTHVRDLFEFLCSSCAPADLRTACPVHHPLNCCDTCLDERLVRCLRQAVETWCQIDCYCVTAVKPPRACPGEEIVIVGKGFGDEPGRVVFRQTGGVQAGPEVKARTWCDDRITVVVPQGAGCGLWLLLPYETANICGRFLQYRRTGCIQKNFEGTAPEILRFGVKGHADGECLEPGVPLRIRWKTCAADRVRVEVLNVDSGAVLASLDPADASGHWDFNATNFNSTVRLRVRITVTGKCQPSKVSRQINFVVQRRPNLSVQGLEVTQAIQFYRADQHMTDAADRGPDNSLRLIANKTAWVRTYLRSGQDPSFENGRVTGVDGTLTVERRVGGVWSTVAAIASQNGPVVAEDSFAGYDAERGNINSTLNFVVPAAVMTGLLRFRVQVASPFQCPGNAASGSTQVDVNLRQTLNAAFITIGYDGPDDAGTGTLNLPAPTLAQCQDETSWAMTTYPVSGAPNVRLGGTFTTTTPLNDPRSGPGECSPNWGPLLLRVAQAVALDQAANPGAQSVYYGIINGGIPVEVPGCSSGDATGGLQGAPVTYAHEMGHQFGLPHARCGNAGGGNAAYPVYEPYDLPVDPPGTTDWTMASIGEYGLDINNGAIANPNNFEDFMSYCGPRWISLYTHTFMLNLAGLSPQVIPTGSGAGSARVIRDEDRRFERDETVIEPLIHMLGTIDLDGNVDVVSVARIETRYLRGRGWQTGYVAQLLDGDGRILAQDNVYSYPSEGGKSGRGGDCGCSEPGEKQPILFKAMLKDVAPGASLRIVKRGETVWERRGSEQPPSLTRASAALDQEGRLKLDWKVAGSYDQIEVWARWSNDDGRTWHALTVGQKGTSVTIDPEQLPSGEVTFQLLANDGFHTVTATTGTVRLPSKPPAVAILYPRPSSPVYAERELHLFGTATSFTGSRIDEEQAAWYIDDELVGNGYDVWVPNPGKGRHEVRLQVTDEDEAGSASTVIDVLPTDA